MRWASWQFTPFTIPCILIGALCAWSAYVAFRKRAFPGAKPFGVLMSAIAGWTLLNTVEKSLTNLQARSVVSTALYVFIVATPFAWFWFALHFSGRGRRLTRRGAAVLAIEPILVLLLAATDGYHGLFRAGMRMTADGGYAVMEISYGPLFWIHLAYTYSLFVAGGVLVVMGIASRPEWSVARRMVLLLGMSAPVVGNAVYVFGVQPQRNVDWTPIYFAVTGLCAFWALFHLAIFDVLPIARDMVVDYISDAVFVLDGRRELLDVNRAARSLLPASFSECRGRTIADLFPTMPSIESAEVHSKEWSLEPSDERIFDVRATELFEDDVLVGSVVRVTDVSERKKAEAERRLLEKALHDAQRLESLKVLCGGVAHDFNNLLQTILGNTELAREEISLSSSATRHLAQVIHASEQARNLANQMLTFAGKKSSVDETIDLGTLIERNQELLRAAVSHVATLEFDLAVGLPPVRGDETQLRQVLINLAMNASEALGEEAGSIRIRTRLAEVTAGDLRDAQVDGGLEPGIHVLLEISDDGAGVEPTALTHIFEPFFSTKFAGRGLGLAIVSGVVRASGGAIIVHSQPRGGADFRILLPEAERRASVLRPPVDGLWQRSATPANVRSELILVADDEEGVRLLAAKVLSKAGYRVTTAADGGEALRLFRNHADELAMALVDLTMPVLGGADVYREIRAADPDLPVVLASGYDEGNALAAFSIADRPLFLSKPFRVGELLQMVRCALKSRSSDMERNS